MVTVVPFENLIRTLAQPSASRWRARIEAARMLSETPLTEAEARLVAHTLLDTLENHLPGDTRNARESACHRWGMVALWPAVGLLALLEALQAEYEWDEWTLYVGAVACGGAFLLPPLIRAALLDWEDFRIDRVRVAAARALGYLRVPETAGALAAATFDPHPRIRAAVRAALRATLPMLPPDHYGALEPTAVPNLCRLLDDNEEGFALEVLEALARVGDSRAVPHVKKVVTRGHTLLVRETAARVLSILQERQRQETDRWMLLRGASKPPLDTTQLLRSLDGMDPPEQLLRSLGSHPDPAPQELLRSVPPGV